MLKRKKFVIQWRKFGLKRSYTFKVMNFWSLWPFSHFYLIFKLISISIFSIKNRKKGYLPVGGDVASGPSDELTRGVQDHRADATRPWGHVAGPRVAHARRRWRTGRGHVAGGHACPRVHANARVGRHVAGRVGRWRAHGLVGPCKIVGAVTRKRYTAPYFMLDVLYLFFRVGLYPTCILS